MDRCSACQHEDKTTWPDGPWRQEPDRLEFKHAGFACLMHRHPTFGNWCGYVGVPAAHSAHGKSYNDLDTIDVHGGLTYSGHCQEAGPICHTPEPGEPDHLYWFGFDCGHAFDMCPGMVAFEMSVGSRQKASFMSRDLEYMQTYRDLEYVQAETKRLAEQLGAMA